MSAVNGPEPPHPEAISAQAAYRRRVRLASMAIVFGLAVVLAISALLPTTTASDRAGLFVSAGLVLLTGAVWFALVPRGWIVDLRLFIAATIAQGVMLILLDLTGGVTSRYFVYYLLPILVLIFSGSIKQAVLLGCVAVAGVLGLVISSPVPVPDTTRDLLVTRVFQLATVTFFAAVTANATGATRRSLASRTAELAEQREAAFQMAVTDELTGLYNRHFMRLELRRMTAHAARRTQPFAVITMDVDGLKGINDSRGHQAGDDLLRSVAEVLRTTLRGEDVAVRIGGDEFVALLPDADRGEAVQAAYRIRQRVAAVAAGQGGASVSAGIAVWTRGVEPDELLRQADEELYRAKAARRAETGTS